MEEDGWREGSTEDKCALSFQRERKTFLEAHTMHSNSFFVVNVRKPAGRIRPNKSPEEPRTTSHLCVLAR